MHKVTIIPRGRALGVTMQLPEQDRYSMDREQILQNIAVLFGGRIAEEIFMGQMTTGASNDFERATEMARNMVTRWGMSDELGPMVYGENEGEVFLGRSVTMHKNVSETTMQKVDAEIRRIIDQQYQLARKLIEDNRDKVEVMAKALLEWETLDAEQINDIMEGRPPRPPKPAAPPAPPSKDTPPTAPRRPRRPRPPEAGGGRRQPRHEGLRIRDDPRSAGVEIGASFHVPRHPSCHDSSAAAGSALDLSRPLVMGVVNVTPDSFSDGGQVPRARRRRRARAAADRGRRGHRRRRRRIEPARAPRRSRSRRSCARVAAGARGAARRAGARCRSIPRKPEVMRAALAAGAAMVNDITALAAPGALEAVAGERLRGVPHAHAGRAADDAGAPRLRATWCARCGTSLPARVAAAERAGIARERIVIDPGFGFGKTLEHNLELLRRLRELAGLGVPVLAGWSRKVEPGPDHRPRRRADRVHASVAAALIAVQNGAQHRARARRRRHARCAGGLAGRHGSSGNGSMRHEFAVTLAVTVMPA